MLIESSSFIGNTAQHNGGGVYFSSQSPYDSVFVLNGIVNMTSNKAGSSGAGYYGNDVEPNISNAKFVLSNNKAGDYGNDAGTYA